MWPLFSKQRSAKIEIREFTTKSWEKNMHFDMDLHSGSSR